MVAKTKDLMSNYEQITETGCWIWLGGWTSKGYGLFPGRGASRDLLAHREFYRKLVGDPGIHMVLHKCDNRPCVNPDHLYLGNAKDNMRDCIARGRKNKQVGQLNSRSRLTDEQVLEIRKRTCERKVDAERFGVSIGTIDYIRNYRSWRHLP